MIKETILITLTSMDYVMAGECIAINDIRGHSESVYRSMIKQKAIEFSVTGKDYERFCQFKLGQVNRELKK